MKRPVALALVAGLTLLGADSSAVASVRRPAPIGPALQRQLAASGPQQVVEAIVVLKSQADLSGIRTSNRAQRVTNTVRTLRAHAAQTQAGIVRLLSRRQSQGLVSNFVPMWVANDVFVSATPAVINELAARAEVREIVPNFTVAAQASSSAASATDTNPVEPNVALVNAPALWASGYRGQGVVVANMDTGVDATHPDLAATWRGGTNSWYDPNGQHPTTPTDVNGHGTQTMGVIVGGAAGGSSIGVAPDAKWIAVKIFNDQGTGTAAGIHLGFQWLLDPDGNPATADAPNVVNASWTMSTPGCNLDFQPDLRSLRAAGILPVFAAGNYGPAAGTVYSPANLPEALAVGGTDNTDTLDPASSIGPSACAGSTSPKLAAPGVSIRTTDLYGGYAADTGTSVAAPHVAGSLALLLSAIPSLSADQQENALQRGAIDLGAAGVDDSFGYGRLDVSAAYQQLTSTPDFAVSASPGSATVVAGGSASYNVTVSGWGGFASDVALSLSGLSASQASWTFTPSVVVGGSGTATLSATTAAAITPGSYPLTLSGTDGTTTHTATASLVVAAPDFNLTAAPSSVTAVAGGNAGYTVTVGALNGFNSGVTLSLTGLSSAVGTASFAPSTMTGAGSSQLTIKTVPTATAGNYSLVIKGTSGSISHTAAITLVVTSFTVTATPLTQSVSAGAAPTYNVSVSALNGFAGDVGLTLTGLPANVGTASFSPSTVTAPGNSTLTISTLTTAPAKSYALTITGTSGSFTRTRAITLVVLAKDFTLSAAPPSVTVTRPASATYTLTVGAVGGFTGNVALTVSGLPAGATASFSATPVPAPGTSTLTVATTATTTRGTFTVRVTGTSGSLTHPATMTLIVR